MAGLIIDGMVKVGFVAPLQVISNQPAFVSDALNLRQQVARQKAQRWEITTNLEPSNDSAEFFIHSITNGYDAVFLIQMPQIYRAPGATKVTNLQTAQDYLKGANSIAANLVGQVAQGEFIRFMNHNKIYTVRKSLKNSGQLDIYPALITAVPGGTIILTDTSVSMQVRYDPTTALGIKYIDGILADPGSVKFVEAL
jgi:hypothetical protein